MNSALLVVLITTLAACLPAWAGWRLDQRRLACATRWRAVPATLLMLVSLWVAVLIVGSFALKVPGAYGPVQYWYNDPAAMDFIMEPRVWVMFAMLGSLWLAPVVAIPAIISLWRPSQFPARRRLVMPGLALAAFGVALWLYVTFRFFPTA